MDNYFIELTRELDSISEETEMIKRVKEASQCLFHGCQEFAWYEDVRKETKSGRNVLQNYIEEEDVLASRKQKSSKQGNAKKKKKSKSLDITSKLYIEFFWRKYKETHGSREDLEKIFLTGLKTDFNEIWEETFSNKKGEFSDSDDLSKLREQIDMSVAQWREDCENTKYIKSFHFENLHNAMENLEKALELSKKNVKDSVEEVLTPDILSYLLKCLKEKNYPGYFLSIAPINKAVWSGEPKSYVGIFFNREYEYNLTQLKKYMSKLMDLYDEYKEISGDIQKITNN